MRKIGFKNFRRFKDFEQIEISGITFVVGKNNSGKSTLVKAILLLNNYFKSSNFDSFQFGNEILEDVNIVTYGRAKHIQAEENLISFTETIENYEIQIDITGNDDQIFGNVYSLKIHDTENDILFIFSFQNKSIKVFPNLKYIFLNLLKMNLRSCKEI
jgi:AAA15 family ATPase/GTPase